MTHIYVQGSPEIIADIHAIFPNITFVWRLMLYNSYNEYNLFLLKSDDFPKKFNNKLVRFNITRTGHIHDHSDNIEYSYSYQLMIDPDQSSLDVLKPRKKK